LTDKLQTENNQNWQYAVKRSHNLDPRIVEVVRLLARRSAQQDFELFLKTTTFLSKTPDEKG